MVRRVVIFWIILWPGVCFSEIGSTYDAYMNWEDWARLRTGFQPGLASSYDREGGNNDFSYYEEPNGLCTGYEPNVTVATIQGPGAIYRFWMPHHTAKRNFVIRMYFDGQETPQIETNSLEWLAGSFNYFTAPLVDTFAGGQVSYEPIPFKKSVRIETENKALPSHPQYDANRHYYQYTYLRFPPATSVDSYTGTLTSQQQTARDSLVSMFNNLGTHPAGSSATAIDVNSYSMVIEPVSAITVADLDGPGIVRKLNLRMDDANDLELEALRLRVYYDDNAVPAIDVAVGNFFGAGKDRALYKSIPLGTDSPEGFYCYWPMPFRDSLVVKLYNSTDANISVDSAAVQYEPNANVEKMCYLHAVENSTVWQPGDIYHPMLSTTGCGHYVGNLLYVEQASSSFYILEGDEVVIVDGTNTLHGTGLEDAYNGGYYYNWVAVDPCEPDGAKPQSAIRALNGIIYMEQNYVRADQYRWQIADCVPFSQSIEVKIENRYCISLNNQWTSVAFWYQYPCVIADFDSDCDVDFSDFAVFGSYWLQSSCQDPNWCGGADFDNSHDVNAGDLATFVKYWL